MSTISNIESTLAIFKEYNEKEASAFLTYIKLAISSFAASESVSQPPSIGGNLQSPKNIKGNSIKERHPRVVIVTSIISSSTNKPPGDTTIFYVLPSKQQTNELDLQMRRRKLLELALPRRSIHNLKAARTGHEDFVAYLCRFHHYDASLECVCG